jgi:hypothetical protein
VITLILEKGWLEKESGDSHAYLTSQDPQTI